MNDISLNVITGEVYETIPPDGQVDTFLLKSYWRAMGTHFKTQEDMIAYLSRLSMPASGNWCFARIPFNPCFALFNVMHMYEFATPLTAFLAEEHLQGDEITAEYLDKAGLFMSPLRGGHAPDALTRTMRFMVLNNPVKRALAMFIWLSQDHQNNAKETMALRMRMSAFCGLNWNESAFNPTGFNAFLEYLDIISNFKAQDIDRVLASQSQIVPKDLFKPYMVCRVGEHLQFLRNFAEEIGKAPPDIKFAVSPSDDNWLPDFKPSRQNISKIQEIFADDYEWYESI